MARIAIVYHSGFGHTAAVAKRIATGAGSADDATAALYHVEEFPPPGAERTYDEPWDALDAADAIILGCPTYMGSVSAPMKTFMDASSGAWFKQAWKDKLAAGFTNAGAPAGNKESTLQALIVFAAQHGMHWITPGIMPSSLVEGDDRDLNRLGASLGLQTQSSDASPEETPPECDRLTAELFGARVAEATLRWLRGA